MLYPVYVHVGDDEHAHGVTVPDFPGCFSAADSWDGLPKAVQEAAELYFDGEALEVPRPTPLEELMQDDQFEGGVWAMVDLDLTRIKPKSVRLNISLPQPLVERIDRYAKAHHLSRSGFIAKATNDAMTGE